MESFAPAPMEGSASPRKPSVAMASRSSPGSLEVAWRSTASARSARAMPAPSSLTRTRLDPARASVERVLHQLLHHRRRPLHHLAGGDTVDHGFGQLTDRHSSPLATQ